MRKISQVFVLGIVHRYEAIPHGKGSPWTFADNPFVNTTFFSPFYRILISPLRLFNGSEIHFFNCVV